LEPPQFEQPQYNLLHRERFEKEYFPIFRPPYSFGTTIWSPLRSGFLTGKYNDGIPEGSRATIEIYDWLREELEERNAKGEMEKIRILTEFANSELDCSITQMALAWCLKNPNVSTILLGATNSEQLEENLGCIEVTLRMTEEHMSKIDEILGNKPDPWWGPGGYGTRDLKTL